MNQLLCGTFGAATWGVGLAAVSGNYLAVVLGSIVLFLIAWRMIRHKNEGKKL